MPQFNIDYLQRSVLKGRSSHGRRPATIQSTPQAFGGASTGTSESVLNQNESHLRCRGARSWSPSYTERSNSEAAPVVARTSCERDRLQLGQLQSGSRVLVEAQRPSASRMSLASGRGSLKATKRTLQRKMTLQASAAAMEMREWDPVAVSAGWLTSQRWRCVR